MAKQQSAKSMLRFSRINYWYFFAAFVFFGFLWLYSMRQNNLTSIRLREQVLKADEQSGDVESALRNLRGHIYSRMNADLSASGGLQQPVQLKYRYERLLEAEKTRVSAANSKIYSDAQAICEQKFPKGLSGSGRIPCIQEYVAKNGVKEQSIPDALYKFDFVSPAWSPDVAGWSLLASLVFLGLFFNGLYLDRRFRHRLRN